MMKGIRRRLDRLNNPSGKFPYKDLLCVRSDAEAELCRVWWQKQNPGVSTDRLLLICSPLPRKDNAEPLPWEITQ